VIIIDDLLAAPFRGLLWIFQEVAEAAEKEQEAEGDRIRDRLRDLYMLLETGQISEDEFDAEEAGLLDRLDEIEAEEGRGEAIEIDGDEDEVDEEVDDEADDEVDDGADDLGAGEGDDDDEPPG
jgi:hypothetical protein